MRLLAALVVIVLVLTGCTAAPRLDAAGDAGVFATLPIKTGPCMERTDGPPPPPGEEVVGLQPIELIFGGSIRHALTRVLLVPPSHGDLGSPTNASRSSAAYLEATLEGMFAWEPAIGQFVAEFPEFDYLSDVAVHIDLFDGTMPAAAGYDITVGYVASGPAFRGVAMYPGFDPQPQLDQAGLGHLVHASNRYILLSLFAYSDRAGQSEPDFPETHELRGVTMHEFAHVWGMGHSKTWTSGCGSDLMNSPYPYPYGDGTPLGDGGIRSPTLCISSLNLYGLAHLYRWLPEGEWVESSGTLDLPSNMQYKEYCVEQEARARVASWLADLPPSALDAFPARP